MNSEEIILRDLDNYLMRMELMVLEQQKNLIEMHKRLTNVLEKYEEK